MTTRIFVENPPPFKRSPRGPKRKLVDVHIDEGLEAAALFLNAGVELSGFHHSDLDPFEAKSMRRKSVPERYPTFHYAALARRKLNRFSGIIAPHRIVVYLRPEILVREFECVAKEGIRDVVLVGKPYGVHPEGHVYHNSVEGMLALLKKELDIGMHFGVIGIPGRAGEARRVADKFEAAGKRLRVMGQFLDGTDTMIQFMDDLVREFQRRHLDLSALEWNVGLAIYALKDRSFFARLLRKEVLSCEDRFAHLQSTDQRIKASITMNLEFAEQIKLKAEEVGMDLGFSVQPIIERNTDGSIHPSVFGTLELVKQLREL